MTTNAENSLKNFEWALKNGELDQVKTLVEKNKSLVNLELSGGRIPLCMAADYGQLDIIDYLIAHHANINVVDKFGITPLLAAIYEGHTDCVRLLVQKGANKKGLSPDGKSYIECADSDEIKKLLST